MLVRRMTLCPRLSGTVLKPAVTRIYFAMQMQYFISVADNTYYLSYLQLILSIVLDVVVNKPQLLDLLMRKSFLYILTILHLMQNHNCLNFKLADFEARFFFYLSWQIS